MDNQGRSKNLRNLGLSGIEIVDDNKRYYPYEDFASHIIGFTDVDNYGSYGIEKLMTNIYLELQEDGLNRRCSR